MNIKIKGFDNIKIFVEKAKKAGFKSCYYAIKGLYLRGVNNFDDAIKILDFLISEYEKIEKQMNKGSL